MIMQWVPPFLLLVAVLIVAVPVAVYLGAIVMLWASSLFSTDRAVSRTRFLCPVKQQSVLADFSTEAGSEHPSNVLSCSAFANPRDVRCAKACLDLAETHAVSMPLMPRYSLIAGGTAYRVAPGPGPAPAGATPAGGLRAA
jgi:hypothetical protein